MSPEPSSLASVPSVEVVGVYPVRDLPEPVHLVELWVRGSEGFDPGEFVQPDPDQPEANWQTAWDERALDASGSRATASFEISDKPELLQGDVRLAFFIHFLNPAQPIRTPFGEVELPNPTQRPDRLASIVYEPP
jgi:hypothetical protein